MNKMVKNLWESIWDSVLRKIHNYIWDSTQPHIVSIVTNNVGLTGASFSSNRANVVRGIIETIEEMNNNDN